MDTKGKKAIIDGEEYDISGLGESFDEFYRMKLIAQSSRDQLFEILKIFEKGKIGIEDLLILEDDIKELKVSINHDLKSYVDETRRGMHELIDSIPNFIKTHFNQVLFTLSDEFSEFFAENIDIENMFKGFHEKLLIELFRLLKRYSIKQIDGIIDIHGPNYIEKVISLYYEIINNSNEVLLHDLQIGENFKKDLKEKLANKYPNVGKNNFSILESSQKVQKEYLTYIKTILAEKIRSYIEINFSHYMATGDCVNDMIMYISSIAEGGFQENYEDFLSIYMEAIFKKISDRKINGGIKKVSSKVIPETLEKPDEKNKEKRCPKKINDFLANFVNGLNINGVNTDIRTQKIIRSYILRIHLNAKSIRIKDLVQNFSISEDVFSQDFISQAKEVGIIFENGVHKKTVEDNTQSPSIENISEKIDIPKIQIEDPTKIAFEKRIGYFIKNTKLFDGIGFNELMILAGYSIENDKYLAKTFDKLYKKDCNMKLLFLNDIKQNIYAQEKISHMKECYRKINLHNSYRILFLMDNKTIDGIYNHTEYEKRIDGKVF